MVEEYILKLEDSENNVFEHRATETTKVKLCNTSSIKLCVLCASVFNNLFTSRLDFGPVSDLRSVHPAEWGNICSSPLRFGRDKPR